MNLRLQPLWLDSCVRTNWETCCRKGFARSCYRYLQLRWHRLLFIQQQMMLFHNCIIYSGSVTMAHIDDITILSNRYCRMWQKSNQLKQSNRLRAWRNVEFYLFFVIVESESWINEGLNQKKKMNLLWIYKRHVASQWIQVRTIRHVYTFGIYYRHFQGVNVHFGTDVTFQAHYHGLESSIKPTWASAISQTWDQCPWKYDQQVCIHSLSIKWS